MSGTLLRLSLLVATTLSLWATFPSPAPAGDFAAGMSPSSVAVDDFNRDGKLDLAVANNRSDAVSVLLGSGDGTFQAAVSYSTGTQSWSVAVGDFNGDQVPDLAVANFDSNNVSILRGLGDGTFQAAGTYAAGRQPRSVVMADFNGDGTSDLAVANFDTFNSDTNDVSVLLGKGDGTFPAPLNTPAGTGSLSWV